MVSFNSINGNEPNAAQNTISYTSGLAAGVVTALVAVYGVDILRTCVNRIWSSKSFSNQTVQQLNLPLNPNLIGNNIEVEKLQQAIKEKEKEIEKITGERDALKTQCKKLKDDIKNKENDLKKKETDLKELNQLRQQNKDIANEINDKTIEVEKTKKELLELKNKNDELTIGINDKTIEIEETNKKLAESIDLLRQTNLTLCDYQKNDLQSLLTKIENEDAKLLAAATKCYDSQQQERAKTEIVFDANWKAPDINSLPANLGRAKSVKVQIDEKNTQDIGKFLDWFVAVCPNIQYLCIEGNISSKLSVDCSSLDKIGELKNLTKLKLVNIKTNSLPTTLLKLNIETLKIHDCYFSKFPVDIRFLSKLKKLSLDSNVFSNSFVTHDVFTASLKETSDQFNTLVEALKKSKTLQKVFIRDASLQNKPSVIGNDKRFTWKSQIDGSDCDPNQKIFDPNHPTVLFIGPSRQGKSSLFDVLKGNLATASKQQSIFSETKKSNACKIEFGAGGKTLQLVDTPGFGELASTDSKMKARSNKEIADEIKANHGTLFGNRNFGVYTNVFFVMGMPTGISQDRVDTFKYTVDLLRKYGLTCPIGLIVTFSSGKIETVRQQIANHPTLCQLFKGEDILESDLVSNNWEYSCNSTKPYSKNFASLNKDKADKQEKMYHKGNGLEPRVALDYRGDILKKIFPNEVNNDEIGLLGLNIDKYNEALNETNKLELKDLPKLITSTCKVTSFMVEETPSAKPNTDLNHDDQIVIIDEGTTN